MEKHSPLGGLLVPIMAIIVGGVIAIMVMFSGTRSGSLRSSAGLTLTARTQK